MLRKVVESVVVFAACAAAGASQYTNSDWTTLKATGTIAGAFTDYSSSFAIGVVPVTTGTWTQHAVGTGAAQIEAAGIAASGSNTDALIVNKAVSTAGDDLTDTASASSGSHSISGTLAAATGGASSDYDFGTATDDSTADAAATVTGAADDILTGYKKRGVTVLARRQPGLQDYLETANAVSTVAQAYGASAASEDSDSASTGYADDSDSSASSASPDSTASSLSDSDSDSDSDSTAAGVSDKSVSNDPISTVSCSVNATLSMTLKNGILIDSKGRIGSIVSNRQFQFDGPPPQAGAIYANGWSITKDGYLAIGTTEIFYRCLSGDFYNLYDQNVAFQCSPIRLLATGFGDC